MDNEISIHIFELFKFKNGLNFSRNFDDFQFCCSRAETLIQVLNECNGFEETYFFGCDVSVNES